MRNVVLGLAVAIAFAGPAAAQDAEGTAPERWIHVPVTGGATGWRISTTVYEDDTDTYEVLRFIYFAEPNTDGPEPKTWVFQQVRIDCDDNTFLLIDGTGYDAAREMVTEQVSDDMEHPIEDRGLAWLIRTSLCDGVSIAGQKEGGAIADVMDEIEGVAPL